MLFIWQAEISDPSFIYYIMLNYRILAVLLLSATVLALPGKIFAGEIHYSRIPVEYWEHRLQMVKALGMNGLSVYVMWNYHEVEPGVFDFSTENRNLSAFLELAIKYKMAVFIRPGPYVCAEWDFGGMPAWLLENTTAATVRTNTPQYMAAVKRYFEAIAPILKKYDSKNGGPIQLLQIENEYGSFGNDLTYINALRQIWKDLGVTTDQYHADPSSVLARSHWSGANMGVNNGVTDNDYAIAKKLDPSVYIFGGEIYPGWLTHWGEPWATRTIDHVITQFTYLCQNNHSFSMYMVHGGSNFGFTAGANMKNATIDYEAHITSYDYDAPINEQGSVTAKYNALRALFLRYADWEVPTPPAALKTISIDIFVPNAYATLLENIGSPIKLTNFTHFESKDLKMYNQGIVVYEIQLPADSHEFTVSVHDYALIYIDGDFMASMDRQANKTHDLRFECKAACKVQIMVEAMGHINFDQGMNTDKKGLIQFTRVKGTGALNDWSVYKLPLSANSISSAKGFKQNSRPVIGRYTFDLDEVGDTFINMKEYAKGYVWINGRNLGRFWNKGPQLKLFCPGVWLKSKNNELIVMEMGGSSLKYITGDTSLKA